MTLFLTDDELARELFRDPARRKSFVQSLPVLERKGFPQKHPMWQARYWPAVKAYLDREAGISGEAAPAAWDGHEDWTDDRTTAAPGTRPRTPVIQRRGPPSLLEGITPRRRGRLQAVDSEDRG